MKTTPHAELPPDLPLVSGDPAASATRKPAPQPVASQASAPQPLMPRLRAATHEQHVELEAQMAPYFAPLTRASYRRLLARWLGFFDAWEHAADRWLSGTADLASRRKAPLLEQDLECLGVDAAARVGLPRCAELPAATSLASVLGVMYVLEGSTLGGQIIARRLEQELGIGRDNGAAFFRCYGGEVGRRWQEFGRWAESHSSPQLDPLAVAGARSTFDLLGRWFSVEATA